MAGEGGRAYGGNRGSRRDRGDSTRAVSRVGSSFLLDLTTATSYQSSKILANVLEGTVSVRDGLLANLFVDAGLPRIYLVVGIVNWFKTDRFVFHRCLLSVSGVCVTATAGCPHSSDAMIRSARRTRPCSGPAVTLLNQ